MNYQSRWWNLKIGIMIVLSILWTVNLFASGDHRHEDHNNDVQEHEHKHEDDHEHGENSHTIANSSMPERDNSKGIHLSEDAQINIGLEMADVKKRRIEKVIRHPAFISIDPNMEAYVSSRIDGKIERIYVNLGEFVRKGSKLVDIKSLEFENLQVDLFQTLSEKRLIESNISRIESLVEKKILPKKELIKIKTDYQKIESKTLGMVRKLEIMGLDKKAVEDIVKNERFIRVLSIRSPITGHITEREAVVGDSIGPEDKIFKISNISEVLIEGDISEDQLSLIKKDLLTRVKILSMPNDIFEGRIDYISRTVERDKRTAHIWSRIKNSGFRLKPGMFAEISIIIERGEERLSVPKSAVLREGGGKFVFVMSDGLFVKQEIITGKEDDRNVEVLKGLSSGELVVTKGVYELRSFSETPSAEDPHAGHTH